MPANLLPVAIPLAEFIPEVSNWWPKEDGTFQAAIFDWQWARNDYVVYETDLASLHPLLPSVIRAMLTWQDATGVSAYADGSDVHATLRYLRGECVTLPSTNGVDVMFSEVRDMTENQMTDQLVTIETTSLQLHSQLYAGQKVPLVKRIGYTQLHVSRSTFDTKYPGWLNRWQTSQAMGMQWYAAYDYVFLPQLPQHTTSLPADIGLA